MRLAGVAVPLEIAGMDVSTVELAVLRRMTPAEKLEVMQALWHQGWRLTVAGVRMRHPDWSDEQVTAEVRELFLRDHA